jgi:hypothetical protein
MTERATKKAFWSRMSLVLTNLAAAVKGEIACLDTATGIVDIVSAIATLIPIGYFSESKTGDGSAVVGVDLFQGLELHWFDNDTGTPVVATDVGNECYLKDGRTVIMTASTRSKAGRVMALSTSKGVLVQCGAAVTGPTGGNGQPASSATRATLKAIAATGRSDGMLAVVKTDGSLWRFIAASTQASDGADELVLVPDAGTGRWVRDDSSFIAKLPIGYGTADNATLFTVPAGFCLRLAALPFWECTTGFTGGTSAAIGVHASPTGYTTKGDVLGGASGDLLAGLATGINAGTIGDKMDTPAEQQALLLKAGDTVKFDRIASVFTAGAGFVCLPVLAMTPA